MNRPLGILDQSPILAGGSPAEAVAASIALAKRAEALGYSRYWAAEHHAMPGLADASPEMLLARLTAETSRIRLGTGGIMLPHYSAYKVAEQFRMLEALAPGRIDLGVGRAPGGTSLVNAALRSNDSAEFPQQVAELDAFLHDTVPSSHPFSRLPAQPTGATAPTLWMLGSSPFGGRLAAEMGLPFCHAHFIGDDAPEVTHDYRARFRPAHDGDRPYVMLALAAIVGETDAEAERLARPLALWRARLFRGRPTTVPTLAEAEAEIATWTPQERDDVARSRRVVVGSPATVSRGIEALAERHGADEVLVVTITADYASRMHSYELLATEAFGRIAA